MGSCSVCGALLSSPSGNVVPSSAGKVGSNDLTREEATEGVERLNIEVCQSKTLTPSNSFKFLNIPSNREREELTKYMTTKNLKEKRNQRSYLEKRGILNIKKKMKKMR